MNLCVHRLFSLGWALVLVCSLNGFSQGAQAALLQPAETEQKVTLKIDDYIGNGDRSIKVVGKDFKSGTYSSTSPKCELQLITTAEKAEMKVTKEKCVPLYELSELKNESQKVNLIGPNGEKIEVELPAVGKRTVNVAQDHRLAKDDCAGGGLIYRLTKGEGLKKWGECSNADFANTQVGTKYYLVADDKITRLTLKRPNPKSTDGDKKKDACEENTEMIRNRCMQQPAWRPRSSICLYSDSGLRVSVVARGSGLRDGILAPNSSMEVFVVHSEKQKVTLALSGETAFEVPGLLNQTGIKTVDGTAATEELVDESKSCNSVALTQAIFGPRTPGSHKLTVKVETDAEPKKSNTFELPFLVRKYFSGAMKLSMAVIVGNSVQYNYEVAKVGGSETKEIILTSGGRAEFEMVVGYTPYVFDRGQRRSYEKTSLLQRGAGFAPYFGLGLISVGNGGDVGFLKSLYVGIEWSPIKNFSLAPTAVLRRVARLRNGYKIGSPVPDGTTNKDLTKDRLSLGFALVLSFTPEIFRIAAGGTGKLFGNSKGKS